LQAAIAALVAAGHKVGVMEQIETGAEAKKRDKNAIVRRQLVNVETPATALDPAGTDPVHLLSVLSIEAKGVLT
jgi:DNA mismatch repair protein MutS